MNYLKLITQFWQLRRSKRITNLQADLYFYLIQECNERGWENPFQCTNKLICASIPISEPSLIDARNRLQQLGLIEFVNGKRNESSPVYTLLYLRSNLNNLSRNRTGALVEPLVESEEKGEHYIDKHKLKRKETKQRSKSHSGATAPGKEKKDLPFWKKFIETFDTWYQKMLKEKYNYLERDFAALKKIYKFFEKRAAEKNYEFNEINLTDAFRYFLNKAWEKDDWLKKNFTLSNLLSQFNSIVNGTVESIGSEKQSTGAAINTGSMLSKINRMSN